ncbi:MAG: hypothetical protein ACOCSQ_03960 [Planctomycetota bacterium]
MRERNVDGTDVGNISKAAMALRRKMWGNLQVLRNHVPKPVFLEALKTPCHQKSILYVAQVVFRIISA